MAKEHGGDKSQEEVDEAAQKSSAIHVVASHSKLVGYIAGSIADAAQQLID